MIWILYWLRVFVPQILEIGKLDKRIYLYCLPGTPVSSQSVSHLLQPRIYGLYGIGGVDVPYQLLRILLEHQVVLCVPGQFLGHLRLFFPHHSYHLLDFLLRIGIFNFVPQPLVNSMSNSPR